MGEKRITGAVSYRSYNAEQIELRLGLTIKHKAPRRGGAGGLQAAPGATSIHPPQGEPKPVPTIIGAARKFPKKKTPARDGELTRRGARPRSAVPWRPYGQRSLANSEEDR